MHACVCARVCALGADSAFELMGHLMTEKNGEEERRESSNFLC